MCKKLFWISIVCFLLVLLYEKLDYYSHIQEIDQIFLQDISSNQHDYIGYIEIEKLGIKREIVLGINDENLKHHVTLSEDSKGLDSENIILAGHSIKNIFGSLHYLQIGDEITIHSLENQYHYRVNNIEIVSKRKTEVLDNSPLILITCTYDDRRLIVKANRI